MSYTPLNNVDNIFNITFYNAIQDNIIEWLDWGLIEKGNYFNSSKDELSPDGVDYSLCKLSNNPNFLDGQAWDGFRPNWIWQSGIAPSGIASPLVGTNDDIPGISGVYVDDIFYPSDTTGTYSHYVDYLNGRIVFDSPIPTGSKVQAEYSYKYIGVIYANSLPWVREINYNSLTKGNDNILPPEMSVQLPCIAVEMSSRRMTPFTLGGGQILNTKVLFHCIAEDEYTRNLLMDIVSYQSDQKLTLFDTKSVIISGDLPINSNGSPAPSALRYPDIISKYPSINIYLRDMEVQNSTTLNSNIHIGIVSCDTELYYI